MADVEAPVDDCEFDLARSCSGSCAAAAPEAGISDVRVDVNGGDVLQSERHATRRACNALMTTRSEPRKVCVRRCRSECESEQMQAAGVLRAHRRRVRADAGGLEGRVLAAVLCDVGAQRRDQCARAHVASTWRTRVRRQTVLVRSSSRLYSTVRLDWLRQLTSRVCKQVRSIAISARTCSNSIQLSFWIYSSSELLNMLLNALWRMEQFECVLITNLLTKTRRLQNS